MEKEGRIVKGLGGLYEVRTNDGKRVMCKARGSFRHDNIVVSVGDYVGIETETVETGTIAKIMERKNILIRPPLANLDILFIVLAAAAPEPFLSTADKLSCIAEFNKIKPAVIVTKSDLDKDKADYIVNVYKHVGIPVFLTNNSGEGTSELSEYFAGEASDKTSAFAGASGVGKTTLMNNLFPELMLATGELSHKISRGRHTTRHVQLYPISELLSNSELTGYVADTPGFSLLDFTRFNFFTKEDLQYTFSEFEPFLLKCKYKKCTHTKEEGCAVLKAISDGLIPKERHESYCELFYELKNKHEWD